MYIGDKENSNTDSALVSTKRSLIFNELNKELYQKFFMTVEELQACRDGYLYIHDMSARRDTMNCCLFDVEEVLTGGFEMGNLWYNEPKTLDVAFDVIGDIVLSAASQQYGGFTVPSVENILAPYAEKSYTKYIEKYLNLGLSQEKAEEIALADVQREEINMTFIRENSEGEYAGSGSWLFKNKPNEVVIQDGVFSRKGCERIIRYAFEVARKEKRSLTSISKGNALNYSMVFWDQIFKEISEEYPDVETRSLLVDAAAMFMVKDPKRFEVVVTSNLFGDILTDLGAAISGGMGLAAGANLNPDRTFPSMFEPIHGSAPDIAGQGISNPMASVWAISQMLDFFGHEDWGKKVLDAIEDVLVDGVYMTPDIGGSASTSQVGDAIVEKLG